MTSTDLVVVSDQAPAVVDARTMLATASLSDVKELHDRAVAAEAYAKAKDDREAYLVAGEIKLWSERAAGRVRRELPRAHGVAPRFDRDEAKRMREEGMSQSEIGRRLGVHKSAIGYAERNDWKDGVKGVPLREFDEGLGVAPGTAYNWEKLSEIPEDRFDELVAQAKERDSSLTAVGILRRDGKTYERRVAPGIYELRDGRLSIRWTKNGVSRMKVLPTKEIAQARKVLAKARGTIKDPTVRVGQTVSDGYSLVRRALQALDNLEPKEFDSEAKAAIKRAITHLHKAEDELVVASSYTTRRRRTA